jgi:hypothetical protein
MRPIFTSTQFLVIFVLNVAVLGVLASHYVNEKVRVINHTQTNTVYKNNNAAQDQVSLMHEAQYV